MNTEVIHMLNLEDLAQFVAFYKSGTLSRVAEEFHISQPTITRTMKRVEEAFGVSLFSRTANRIEFNEVGLKAVAASEELLSSAERILSNIQEFERTLQTISVISCAPAPLWSLIPALSGKHNGKTISSKLADDTEQVKDDFLSKKYDIAILPYSLGADGFTCRKYLEEHLSICVPVYHALAKFDHVNTSQINGYNCLLNSDIGFWSDMCRKSMPSSKFLVQTDEFAFRELMAASSLPYFTTDLANERFQKVKNRVTIPITDERANVSYYLCQWKPYYEI